MVRPWVTVVSGIPRSGTSMVLQMLRAGGMPIATDHARAPDADNPRGYLELERVKELAAWSTDDLAALRGFAVKVVLPLLYQLPDGVEVRVVVLHRGANEVLESQRRMLERRGVTGRDRDDAALLGAMRRERARSTAWLERTYPGRWLQLEHGDVVRDPLAAAGALDRLVVGLDVAATASAVASDLHRCRSDAGAGQR